ncbi:MAG: ABC transporter permease [Gemmataceae bacterium]|nr:ABC transporter permease [Gemmataceae bacterium]
MNFSVTNLAVCAVLALIQVLAALPWLWIADPRKFGARTKSPTGLLAILGWTAAGAVFLTAMLAYRADPAKLEFDGRLYGSVLQLQLSIGLVLGILGAILTLWPKGGTVAMAAFREGYRQPMFWLLAGVVTIAILVSMVIPYFTFGEDFRMMKQLSFDMIKLSTVLFAVLAAGMSVSEEIEGRTAVTLMSKPVTRRQFLLGKYFGILLAALALTLILCWVQNWALYMKPHFERLEDSFDPLAVEVQGIVAPKLADLGRSPETTAFLRGIGLWFGETLANSGGLALGFGQVLVMLAIAVSLATRMSMIVTMVVCGIVFLLGTLTSTLAEVTKQVSQARGGTMNLVNFIAQLGDKVFPAFNYFSTDQVYLRETYLPPGQYAGYVGSVFGYAVLYAAMALLVGLFLIEDRDLA